MVSSSAAMHDVAAAGRKLRKHPIDMAHLARQTMGDEGLEYEVLRLFDQMVKVYYGRLERATSVDELIMNLHALKGAAAGVGAFGVATLARTMEAGLKAGNPVNPEQVDDIGIAVEEVSAFVSERLGTYSCHEEDDGL